MSNREESLPLGREVDYPAQYAPELLYPLSRMEYRESFGLDGSLPFHGWDLWTAWELSWLDPRGKPRVAVARLAVPCDSPAIIESKSLKLYLNSFYQTSFADAAAVEVRIADDLSQRIGTPVTVELLLPGHWANASESLPGTCLDDLELDCSHYQPAPVLLGGGGCETVRRRWYSHLLRTLCPVTGQPDWATVLIDWHGPDLDPAALLRYLVSFRQHQGFHEQCVERIFMDLWRRFRPAVLTVEARFLRRGGIDINPLRSSRPLPARDRRLFRQ